MASASAVTSSPPITRLSLLASATSIPSVSATIVGPRPAAPTIPLSTRSAPEERDQLGDPLLPGEHLAAPQRPAALGGGGVGERERRDPVLARLLERLVGPGGGGQADDLQLLGAAHDLQRLGADRPGGAQDQDLASCA